MQYLDQGKDVWNSIKKQFCSLMNLKTVVPENLAGLDISSESIKLLKLNRNETPPRVENFAVATLPPDTFIKDEIKNQAVLSDALRDLFRQAEMTTNQVALAIPRAKAITKTINIDKRLTEEDIESRAWIEANKHFPDLVGDIYLDFFVNGTSPQDASQLEITLVASRKDQIKAYLDVLRVAGLQAKIIDVDSYALERSLTFLVPNPSIVGLLNLNLNVSSLIVVPEGHLTYAHAQTFDGARLKTQLNEFLKTVDANGIDADKLLENPGYQTVLRDNLLAHLRHTMQFFYTSRPNMRMQNLILSGDLATIPAIAPFIQKETGIETSIADLSSHFTFNPRINTALFKTYSPALMLTCGLALTKGMTA